jgi:hypothetical protein
MSLKIRLSQQILEVHKLVNYSLQSGETVNEDQLSYAGNQLFMILQ